MTLNQITMVTDHDKTRDCYVTPPGGPDITLVTWLITQSPAGAVG